MRFLSPLKAYALAVPLTVLMTWALLLTQNYVAHVEKGHVRPFGIGFLLAVALVTILGGRGPGIFTLVLSTLSMMLYLTPLGSGGLIGRPRDWTEAFLLLCVGGALVRGLEALHLNTRLLAESEEARARLRAVMDTAPVGIVLSDLKGALQYANREAERVWGQSQESRIQEGIQRYKVLDTSGFPTRQEQTSLARVLAGEAAVVREERILEQADGTRIVIDSSSTVVRDQAGRPHNGLVIFSDITERKRAERQVQRLLARERLISKISQVSLQTLDLDCIQSEAAAGLIELLSADRVFFHFYEGNTSPDLPSRTVVVPDVREAVLGAHLREMMAYEEMRSAIIVPLFDGDCVAATLNVAMTGAARDWEPDEISLAEAVATQTRVGVKAAQTQTREHAIAVALQDALIPSPPKRVSGLVIASYYKAALAEANVGGDFLDVFALKDGQVVFAVGDLSGKGLAAASQVATIRNMLRYSLYRTPSLDQAIRELNATIVLHDLLTGFATLFIGIYDEASRVLTYLSCGHDPGLLRAAAGGEIILLPDGAEVNPVLGLTEASVFSHKTVTLAPGDTLFLCTDGVTEAGRNRGEFLGVAGVAAMLEAGDAAETVEELVSRIVAEVRDYAQGELHDDVCLLAAIVGE